MVPPQKKIKYSKKVQKLHPLNVNFKHFLFPTLSPGGAEDPDWQFVLGAAQTWTATPSRSLTAEGASGVWFQSFAASTHKTIAEVKDSYTKENVFELIWALMLHCRSTSISLMNAATHSIGYSHTHSVRNWLPGRKHECLIHDPIMLLNRLVVTVWFHVLLPVLMHNKLG